ncbi:hypothetical protein BpHYR1_040737 [Brachionus plicatilis]|uniref:Uncharacterized protein n=1 Tax=Brachionus plicatilis TaxID=10195 RepID=A0A3M7RK78_BRAPC|nr:hypothetical protein BpHYR1_040737 [Brachionus plicatilis]
MHPMRQYYNYYNYPMGNVNVRKEPIFFLSKDDFKNNSTLSSIDNICRIYVNQFLVFGIFFYSDNPTYRKDIPIIEKFYVFFDSIWNM